MSRSHTFTSTVAEVARLYLMPVENRANLMTEVVIKGATGGDTGSGEEQEESRTQPPDEPLQDAASLDKHNVVLADDVWWRHRFDVRQHIQHLLVRQLAAKAVHRTEQYAIRDRHEQFPIGLGANDRRLKIRRSNDQILAVRALSVQLAPVAAEAVLFVDGLSFLGISPDSLSYSPGTSQYNDADRSDNADTFHVVRLSVAGG